MKVKLWEHPSSSTDSRPEYFEQEWRTLGSLKLPEVSKDYFVHGGDDDASDLSDVAEDEDEDVNRMLSEGPYLD